MGLTKELYSEWRECGNHTLSFGKHKNKAIKDLPLDYLEWLATECKGHRLESICASKYLSTIK